jgi:putative transposase
VLKPDPQGFRGNEFDGRDLKTVVRNDAHTVQWGEQYVCDGRKLFDRFSHTIRDLARLQSKRQEGRYSSERIRWMCRERTRRRDHAQAALCRDLLKRLYAVGVDTLYIGGLTGVLGTHWSDHHAPIVPKNSA